MARRTSLPVIDREDEEDEVTTTETGESYEPFCRTAVDEIPEKEQSLYRRTATVLAKAGITSPAQLREMPFGARMRIKGLGRNGLELIEETFATGEEERIALLFQPQEGRQSALKYGPSLIPGLTASIYHRLKEGGIADTETLRQRSDYDLRQVKGLGPNAIQKIRDAGYSSGGLSDEALAMIEENPRKASGTIVRDLVAEVRRARQLLRSSNGFAHDDDDEDDED